MDATWKAAERAVAKLLGGRRLPVNGRGDQPDVVSGWCAVEVKHRKRLPGWLLAALAQARRVARDGQLPVAVLHPHGGRHTEDLVVLRLADFADWFGPILATGKGVAGAGNEPRPRARGLRSEANGGTTTGTGTDTEAAGEEAFMADGPLVLVHASSSIPFPLLLFRPRTGSLPTTPGPDSSGMKGVLADESNSSAG